MINNEIDKENLYNKLYQRLELMQVCDHLDAVRNNDFHIIISCYNKNDAPAYTITVYSRKGDDKKSMSYGGFTDFKTVFNFVDIIAGNNIESV